MKWVRGHIRVIGKTLPLPSCPPSMPLPVLSFLAVESFRKVLAISFSFLKSTCILYPARFARLEIERQRVGVDRFIKMVLVSCLPSCHNLGSLFAWSVCPPCFDLAPKPFSDLKPGSVNACHLTRHAADGGYVPRFLAFVWLWAFLRFDGASTLPPTAANAHPLGSKTGLISLKLEDQIRESIYQKRNRE